MRKLKIRAVQRHGGTSPIAYDAVAEYILKTRHREQQLCRTAIRVERTHDK
ncbi:MAG: hypothetical protein IPP88_12060 [Betaproteobacteria bacterium]|nr:hypothetical protein [Betaproteobacteria bacterium]